MIVESQFANVTPRKPRLTRKRRENWTIKVEPARMARGRYPKGAGFNKRTRIKGRKPILGDRIAHNEDALYWLRVKRA